MLNEAEVLRVLGRPERLFEGDLEDTFIALGDVLSGASILVLGAAGSIGGATVMKMARFRPRTLDLVDSNENELAEMVRKMRITGVLGRHTKFATFAIDINSAIFDQFCKDGRRYDFVFNFAAMKHVRSESNAYSLMRMIETNIVATNRILGDLLKKSDFKYFCVSTDKAANPANLMGLTKLIMESYAFSNVESIEVSSARFANVAFSNGSLLQSFDRRFFSEQSLVVPKSIRRFFVTEAEAGAICTISGVSAAHGSILIPSSAARLELTAFEDIVVNYLRVRGYTPRFVSENEEFEKANFASDEWPVIVSDVDTTGEKPFEEFSTVDDKVITGTYRHLDVILKDPTPPKVGPVEFEVMFRELLRREDLGKADVLRLLENTGINIDYVDFGKYLDDKL